MIRFFKLEVATLVTLSSVLTSFSVNALNSEVAKSNVLTGAEAQSLLQMAKVNSFRQIDVVLVPSTSTKEEVDELSHGNQSLKQTIKTQIYKLSQSKNANAMTLPYQVEQHKKHDVCVIAYQIPTLDKGTVDVKDLNQTLRHELGHCYQNYLIDTKHASKDYYSYGQLTGLHSPATLWGDSNKTARSTWNRYNQEVFAELTTATLEYRKNHNFDWLNERISDYEYKYNLPVYSLGEPLLIGFKTFVEAKVKKNPSYFDELGVFEAIDDVYENYFLPNALKRVDFIELCQRRKEEEKSRGSDVYCR